MFCIIRYSWPIIAIKWNLANHIAEPTWFNLTLSHSMTLQRVHFQTLFHCYNRPNCHGRNVSWPNDVGATDVVPDFTLSRLHEKQCWCSKAQNVFPSLASNKLGKGGLNSFLNSHSHLRGLYWAHLSQPTSCWVTLRSRINRLVTILTLCQFCKSSATFERNYLVFCKIMNLLWQLFY